MRTVSDHITGSSPIIMAVVVGSSILSIVGVGYGLYAEAPVDFVWHSFSQDYKILLGVFFITLLVMTGLCWMLLNLSITIKADKNLIRARIFPFMRSYREIPVSEVLKMEVIDFSGGLTKYGGVGYKKQLGGMTSYTLHLKGHALRIVLPKKKELHVQISKIEQWKRYVESFQNRNL